MTILTIFFCGTAATRLDNTNTNYCQGELVSTLAANNEGREFAEWIIIDGPGSGNLQDDELWVKSGEHFDALGKFFGLGWQENIRHAIAIMKGEVNWQREKLTEKQYETLKNAGVPIQDVEVTGSFLWRHFDYGDRKVTQQQLQQQIIKIYRKGQILPTQVNLVGWSRGGISCHMLANAMLMDPLLTTIPVNIFAIDPVPGPLNFESPKTTLGKNVKEYVAFYARDERSKGFSCVIPETAKSTAVHVFPMAGRHATLVGNSAIDGDKGIKLLNEPGIIVRYFAETCLQKWGVKLRNTLNLDEQLLLKLHQGIKKNEDLYLKMHKLSYSLLTENDRGERYVSLGSHGVPYSAIRGGIYTPHSGLASDYLNDTTLYDILK